MNTETIIDQTEKILTIVTGRREWIEIYGQMKIILIGEGLLEQVAEAVQIDFLKDESEGVIHTKKDMIEMGAMKLQEIIISPEWTVLEVESPESSINLLKKVMKIFNTDFPDLNNVSRLFRIFVITLCATF